MTNPPTLSTQNFLKKASAVATHYGFSPVEMLMTERPTTKNIEVDLPQVPESVRKDPFGNLAASLLTTYALHNLSAARRKETTLIYHIAYSKGASGQNGKSSVQFGLAALGCSKSIGEALIIKTSLAILGELGVKNTTVYLNSVGDRDSVARFGRELSAYLRRHMNDLSQDCQQALKRDPFEALELLAAEPTPFLETLPRPLHFLSETSRRHLREVLEFLELDNISYAIEDKLIGHRDCYSQTLFEIREKNSDGTGEKTFVRGGRFDELARKSFRSNIPMVGAAFEHRLGSAALPAKIRLRRAKFFLVQVGHSAKLLSLSVLESLRKAHIPVNQSVGGDSLSDQLEAARACKSRYLLIMGQREVLDKTVIVRNMNSQAQQVVPILTLPDYLKETLKI